HRVVGVDVDRAMLARARSRATAAGVADRVRLVEADLRDVRLPDAGRYRLAFVALNTLLLLAERADQAAAVETLAAHLAPGGLAVVDVWLPDADDLGRFDGRLALEYVRREPSSGRLVAKLTSAVHDPVRATVELTTIHDEGAEGEPPVRWIRHDRLRLVGVDELVGFVESAGLRVEQLAGGYDLGPLGPGSERVVLVATRPE
ncbi:MAG TPA: class I SAM-dependent methyltransferase, partial [Candidatus Limnocylindrales bacterium]|nr:class I SAM-dependent methyltransferase [Candidatus Limnocylindrales bacterium]